MSNIACTICAFFVALFVTFPILAGMVILSHTDRSVLWTQSDIGSYLIGIPFVVILSAAFASMVAAELHDA